MGFEALLGNRRIKENLTRSLHQERISHFYLIAGPAGSGKHTLARLLGAAILCQGEHKPCGACDPCRKVLRNTHPDFITVDDPEKKTVPVDLIRKAREDVYIRPNEAQRKIYLFPRGQDMRVEAQNALLKILEEPPAYGVFILLTDNPEKLLPTVRSRCTLLQLESLPEELLRPRLEQAFPQAQPQDITAAIGRSGGWLGQALALLENGAEAPQTAAFVKSYAARDRLGLLQILAPMERWKRDQLIPLLEQWITLLHEALLFRSGVQALSPAARVLGGARSAGELNSAIGILKKCVEYAQGNVSVAAICGYLVWAI